MAESVEYDRRKALIESYVSKPEDIREIVGIISETDPNESIGIPRRYIPPVILNVLVTGSAKYVFIPEEIGYMGEEAIPVDPDGGRWKYIPSRLDGYDLKRYIGNLKLGAGTAWESGLQLAGPDSRPEWSSLVRYLEAFAIGDPNYPAGQAPSKIIPSIILPPPGLRRGIGTLLGTSVGSPLELRVTRRHELSHVIEMALLPWPTRVWFGETEGFPPENGAAAFHAMIRTHGVIPATDEARSVASFIPQVGKMPRGHIGELQAYLGDFIYYHHLSEMNLIPDDPDELIRGDVGHTEKMFRIHGQTKNYFGAGIAWEIIRQTGVDGARRFLMEIYDRISGHPY